MAKKRPLLSSKVACQKVQLAGFKTLHGGSIIRQRFACSSKILSQVVLVLKRTGH